MRQPWIWRFRCTRRTAGRSSSSRARSTFATAPRLHDRLVALRARATARLPSTSKGSRCSTGWASARSSASWPGCARSAVELVLVAPSSTTRELLAADRRRPDHPDPRPPDVPAMSDDQRRRRARLPKPDELLALGSTTAEMFAILRTWFDVPPRVSSRPGRRRLRGHRARRSRDDRGARDAQAPGAAPPRDARSAHDDRRRGDDRAGPRSGARASTGDASPRWPPR